MHRRIVRIHNQTITNLFCNQRQRTSRKNGEGKKKDKTCQDQDIRSTNDLRSGVDKRESHFFFFFFFFFLFYFFFSVVSLTKSERKGVFHFFCCVSVSLRNNFIRFHLLFSFFFLFFFFSFFSSSFFFVCFALLFFVFVWTCGVWALAPTLAHRFFRLFPSDRKRKTKKKQKKEKKKKKKNKKKKKKKREKKFFFCLLLLEARRRCVGFVSPFLCFAFMNFFTSFFFFLLFFFLFLIFFCFLSLCWSHHEVCPVSSLYHCRVCECKLFF